MWLQYANFVVQVVIAFAALFALQQIYVAKQTSVTNSRRESIRYASELTKDYLGNVIGLSDDSTSILRKNNFESYHQSSACELSTFKQEEIGNRNIPRQQHFLRYKKLVSEHPDVYSALIAELNARESFATPFVSKVADELVAFKAVGRTFCEAIERRYFALCYVRSSEHLGFSYFENTVELYNLWSARLRRSELESKSRKIKEELGQIEEHTIVPIGTSS